MAGQIQATDISGPCFNYDSVVASNVPCINSSQVPAPLLFCEGIPFNISSPLVSTLGPGCDGKNPCWALGQRLQGIHEEGPLLTELTTGNNPLHPKIIVGAQSPSKAVYYFEKYEPVPADGYKVSSVILLAVVQPGDSVGYIAMHTTPAGDPATAIFPTTILTKAEAVAANVMWGVIGAGTNNNNIILMYYDNILGQALPLVQMFSWGQTMYLSRGLPTNGSTGTFGAFHGVTTSQAFPGLTASLVSYSPTTLMQTPNTLPLFSTQNQDNGAFNIQWTLKALPISNVSAHIYVATYCSSAETSGCKNGAPACSIWQSDAPQRSTCAALTSLYPDERGFAMQKLCNSGPLLSTEECVCVNPSQSGYALKSLGNKTVNEFLAWSKSKIKHSIFQKDAAQCWVPDCVAPPPGVYVPSGTKCDSQDTACSTELKTLDFSKPKASACQEPSKGGLSKTAEIIIITLSSAVGVTILTLIIVYFWQQASNKKKLG